VAEPLAVVSQRYTSLGLLCLNLYNDVAGARRGENLLRFLGAYHSHQEMGQGDYSYRTFRLGAFGCHLFYAYDIITQLLKGKSYIICEEVLIGR
jgi:hypothetical protein